jgi:hypothetical protein
MGAVADAYRFVKNVIRARSEGLVACILVMTKARRIQPCVVTDPEIIGNVLHRLILSCI